MKSNYYAIVALPSPISLTNCALVHRFSAIIGGHKLILHTPLLVPADENTSAHFKYGDYHQCLAQPKIAMRYIRSDADIDWGSLHGADSKGNVMASVKHLFAVFPESPADIEKFAHEVHVATFDWFNHFDAFMRIISNQRTTSSIRVEGDIRTCLRIEQHKPWKHLQPRSQTIEIIVTEHKAKNFATRSDLINAMRLCSKEKELSLQYQLFLRACDAFQENDFRNVVIESATALEVAATRRIRTEMQKNKATDQHIKLMLEGHKMLRNRLELLKKINVPLPCTPKNIKDLLDLRNKVVHVGKAVDANQATKVLRDTETIIRAITPEFAEDAN